MNILLSIVVPCYNEQSRFKKGLFHLLSFLMSKKYTWELIFVNDGSTDQTGSLTLEASKRDSRVKIINYKKNKGKGYAIKRGVKSAKGKYIFFSDIDHSVPINTVDKFLKFFDEGYQAVFGSRRTAGAKLVKRQTYIRETLGRGFTLLVKIFIDWNIKDATCGFKAFEKNTAKKLFSKITIFDWAFDAELAFLSKKYGYRTVQAPVVWSDARGSKVSIYKDVLKSLWGLIKIHINDLQGKYK